MNYGFIGLGNMAGAILAGMHSSGKFENDKIYGFNRSSSKTMVLKEKIGLIPCKSALEVVENAEVIVLAVKPQMLQGVLDEIADKIKPNQTVISIAAGKPTAWYENILFDGVPVVRVMPNINAKVGAAVSAICAGQFADDGSIEIAKSIFATVGKTYVIDEKMFGAFSAIGGASGAFVYMYIDALADAGVRAGFPRDFSVDLATQTVLGSAKLVDKSGEHPRALVNQVCSPGGTTIEGVLTLKRLGFESAVDQAIEAIIEKDTKLGK